MQEQLEIVQAGMDAYHANQSIDDCPYSLAGDGRCSEGRRKAWMSGWLDARSWYVLGHIFKKYGMKH